MPRLGLVLLRLSSLYVTRVKLRLSIVTRESVMARILVRIKFDTMNQVTDIG